eukprot:TRINITY_DN12648_c0_g1_i1.p1 TRINITY_DN12648_c0_g1~~TRINITY_DN12648_c0_g1_i1.p1  ORF type:complete len:514 (+),score=105.55 TRINITY_DN12648_c0_g1_i1:140-1681(+)
MDLSVWFFVKSAFLVWFIIQIYRLLIREWIYFIFYWKQGLSLDSYKPVIGMIFQERNDEILHGDCAYSPKEIVRKDPKKRVIMLNALGRALLLVVDHSLIEEYFKKSNNCYEKDPLFTYSLKRAMGNGTLFAEGSQWKLHRRILSEAFEFSNLKKMQPIITEAIIDHFNEMEREGRLTRVHIMDEFQKITGDIVLKSFFGSDFSKRSLFGKSMTKFLAEYIEAVNLQMVRNPLTVVFGPQIIKYNLTANDRLVSRQTDALRALAWEVINKRRSEKNSAYIKGEERKHLLDFILDHNEKNKEEQLSDNDIIDEFVTLFIAGMDTTGHLLGLSTYYLLKHPEYVERIMNEAKENGINFDAITIDSLAPLKQLDAFIKEVLRFGTPTLYLLLRRAKVTHELGDLTILKGTMVTVGLNTIGFNELYFDQPYEFRPERFLNSDGSEKKNKYPFAYIPFSAGARNCIGKYLALIEAKSILLTFLKRYSFKFSDPNYKLRMGRRFLYEPVDPIRLDLTNR